MQRIILPFLLSALLHSAGAQTTAPDTLCARADSLLFHNNPAGAADLYEKILDEDETNSRALLGLGKARLMERDWGGAASAFADLLEADTANIESQYYLGVCHRELGTTKASLLRKWEWNTAEEFFQAVIDRDSLYRDVFYQLALLQRYRGKFPDAVALGHRQLDLTPDVEEARIGLFKLYKSFVTDDRPAAIDWLRGQHTTIAEYFLAEALRRQGELDAAESSLRGLLYQSKFPLAQPVYLSLARIAVERGEPQAVEGYYLRAIDELLSPLGAKILFEDIKYLLSDSELAEYLSLATVRQMAAFFRGFWAVRNPSATSGNARISEHYRRLVRAEQDFEYTGFRTEFTNPDRMKYLRFPAAYFLNEEYNDKGLIFIRHGQPDNILRSLGSTEGSSESWLYESTGESPRRIFHFFNAKGNVWRLSPYPQDPSMIANLATWDPRFADLASQNTAREMKIRDELIAEEQTAVEEALATDNHTWTREVVIFTVSHSIEAFRSTEGRALLDISYAIPLSAIARQVASERTSVPTEIGIAIRDLEGRIGIVRADTVAFPIEERGLQVYTSLYRYRVPPGEYSIAMHVRPLGTNLYSSWNVRKTVPSFVGPDVTTSDVQFLLPSTVPSALEFDGIKVAPNPYRQHPVDRPLYVYLQIYHLQRDQDSTSAYDVRFLAEPAAEQGSPGEVSSRHTQEIGSAIDISTEEFAALFKKLDISGLSPGRYTLIVSVTDRRSGKGTRLTRPLEVFAP